MKQATERLTVLIEAMQKHLPHDAQYRNRIRRDW